jgi:long-chain acyl-CoA synthetase
VLALRGGHDQAAKAVDRANAALADFQQIRRWMIWPEPDLPRTSTGKVRRKAVANWVAGLSVTAPPTSSQPDNARPDWLYTLVAEIAGEQPSGSDDLRLNEDFHLDSLGRVQLAAALDERLADAPEEGSVDAARTLGDLRRLAGTSQGFANREGVLPDSRPSHLSVDVSSPFLASPMPEPYSDTSSLPAVLTNTSPQTSADVRENATGTAAEKNGSHSALPEKAEFVYPHWPWWKPVQWVRAAFLELIAQQMVWFLGKPVVSVPANLRCDEPMLIICNHVTAYDGALVEYALPGPIRRWVAAAMLGEMLEAFRHFRDPDTRRFMLFGPAAYWLVTALYNVFPLPRRRDFQRSFAHVGEAMDRGYNVLVFPEGTRSVAGELASFRPGIGLLAKQTSAPVLPIAIVGLGELKARGGGWFRSGKIEVRVGEPIGFSQLESESSITRILHEKVSQLMKPRP